MTRRMKRKAFEIFYTKFKTMEVYNYTIKVLKSCETVEQTRAAGKWGMNVLNNQYQKICNYIQNRFESISLDLYVVDRIIQLETQFEKEYKQTRKKFKTVKK